MTWTAPEADFFIDAAAKYANARHAAKVTKQVAALNQEPRHGSR